LSLSFIFYLTDLLCEQATRVMAPFRNSGWPFYEKFLDIIPNATARGGNAFSPANTAAPGVLGADDEAEEDLTGGGASGHNDVGEETAMAIDRDIDSSTLISTTTKRKHTALTSEGDTGTLQLDTIPSSSINTSSTSSNFSSEPALKKASSVASSKSQLKAPSTRRSKTASSRRSSHQKTVDKLTPELLVHEVQGTINMLTSTVRDSMEADPITKVRQDAVRLLQTRDDGLSPEQKIIMFQKLTTTHAVAQVYLAIHDEGLRRAWLQQVCNN
jgi:hypothetical protein